MKVVVTGSSGFIGQHVVRELIKNHNVIILTRSKNNILRHDWFEDINYIETDIYDSFNFSKNFNIKPDALVHLSWQGIPHYKDKKHVSLYYDQNLRFLKAAIDYGIENIAITGSCLEYGLREGELDEKDYTEPVTEYGKAKDMLRKKLQRLANDQVALKWIRLFYMYGEGQNPKSLIPQLHVAHKENKKIFGISSAEHIRDFMKVEEIANFICQAIDNTDINGVINCCSGNPIRLGEFLKNYCDMMGINIEIKSGLYPENDYEPRAFWGKRGKMNKILNNE